MTRVAIPALIVMLAVAGFVGAGAWNESDEPLLVITLTERELRLVRSPATDEENSSLQLQVAFEYRVDPLDARNWLPESRLREIGFDLEVPEASTQAPEAYRHVPPRLAWVAFEYDGPLYRDFERRRQLLENPEAPVRHMMMYSRLVPVDVASDFEVLHRRYPTGHLIMRAIIRLVYSSTPGGGGILHGVLREVVPQQVSVPHRFRPVLEGMEGSYTVNEPRFEVELAIGRLGLPYIRSLRSR